MGPTQIWVELGRYVVSVKIFLVAAVGAIVASYVCFLLFIPHFIFSFFAFFVFPFCPLWCPLMPKWQHTQPHITLVLASVQTNRHPTSCFTQFGKCQTQMVELN